MAAAETGGGGSGSGSRAISVATPEDLDKLLEWVGGSIAPPIKEFEGEHLFGFERLVVSPAAGAMDSAVMARPRTIVFKRMQ